MKLNQELLDEENEKILSKLDNTIGISQNKEVLRDIIKYSQVIKAHSCNIEFENYNIIIRNKSAYNLYEELIIVISDLYFKNNIIHQPNILYMTRDDLRFNKIKKENYQEIEEGIIVFDLTATRRSINEIKKDIDEMVQNMSEKVFIILENEFIEGETNALFTENFSWAMKIDQISNEEKEKYIKKFMNDNKLKCKDETIKVLADNPYYKIKNDVINILVKCKIKNERNIENVMDNSSLEVKKITKSKNKAIEEFNSLIGLEDVKKQIIKVINFIKISKDRKNLPMLHMCFNGNPGTGKTTVARIVGKIFAEENILSNNEKFVEIHGRDLVGKYVGWTAGQTKEKIKEAEGGVLFIDEAYSLISDRLGGYEEEAIATLLKEMEDKRDKVCVIIAGYSNRMKELLEMNPGFESRIQFKINFPDYSSDELYNIFKFLCKNENYKISPNIKQVLLQHLKNARKVENFSNGRYVRNIFEKIKIEQANRVIKEKNNNLILKCDIIKVIDEIENEEKETKKIIGFKIK